MCKRTLLLTNKINKRENTDVCIQSFLISNKRKYIFIKQKPTVFFPLDIYHKEDADFLR